MASSASGLPDCKTFLDVLDHLDKFDGTGPGCRFRFQADHMDVVADPRIIVRIAALLRQEMTKATHNRVNLLPLTGGDIGMLHAMVGRVAADGMDHSPAAIQAVAEAMITYCHQLCDE